MTDDQKKLVNIIENAVQEVTRGLRTEIEKQFDEQCADDMHSLDRFWNADALFDSAIQMYAKRVSGRANATTVANLIDSITEGTT